MPCKNFLTLVVFLQSSSTPKARRKQPATSTPDANASKRRKTVASKTSSQTAAKAKSQTATTQSQGEQPRLTQSGVSKPVEPVADQVHDESVPSDGGDKSTPEKMTGSFTIPGVERVKKSDWLNASQSASDADAGRPENDGEASLPPPPINLSPPSFSTG